MPYIPAMSFDGGSSLTVLRLYCSLCLQPEYNNFWSRLGQSLPLLDRSTPPTTGDGAIDAVLEVLQTEKEDCDKMDDSIALATDRDENMAEEAGQPQAPADEVDNALKILVYNATEEFGFAPRDVYGGVFNLPETKAKHAAAVKEPHYLCSRLETFLRTFPEERRPFDFPDRVVVAHPHYCRDSYDKWEIDFKSIRIRREVVELMRLEEVKYLQKTYDLFHRLPKGNVLAGRVFEAIVHSALSGGWQGPRPQPICMVSDGGDPPSLSSTPGTSLSFLALLRAGARVVTQVDLNHGLSSVTLGKDKYYTSATTNNPLFDSFTIDHDLKRCTVVISVFQIAISSRHEGSAEGYPFIHKIMARVCKPLKEAGLHATVNVTYFLICPEDGSQHQWQMQIPINWNENFNTHDRQGNAFCIRVPLLPRRGMSCPFTPSFAT